MLFLPVGLGFRIHFFSHLRCQAHFLCGLDKKCRQLTVKKVCKNKMTESVEQAFKKGHIGKRQHNALKKHAEKHSEEHISKMLSLMRHTTLANAHKLATIGQSLEK